MSEESYVNLPPARTLYALALRLQHHILLQDAENERLRARNDRMSLIAAKYGDVKTNPVAALNRDCEISGEMIRRSALDYIEDQQEELENVIRQNTNNETSYIQLVEFVETNLKHAVEGQITEKRLFEAKEAQLKAIIEELTRSLETTNKNLEEKLHLVEKLESDLIKEQKLRLAEENSHRLLIKYLIRERKRLYDIALNAQENNHEGASTQTAEQLKKEIVALREERDRHKSRADQLQDQNEAMSKELRAKKESNARLTNTLALYQQATTNNTGPLPNKAYSVPGFGRAPAQPGMHNSSSYPITAPGTSAPRPQMPPRPNNTAPPPHKKYPPTTAPQMGAAARSNGIRGYPTLGTKASNIPNYRVATNGLQSPPSAPQQQKRTVEELGDLGRALGSPNARYAGMGHRSSSLPRGTTAPQGDQQQQHHRPSTISKNSNNPLDKYAFPGRKHITNLSLPKNRVKIQK